MYNPEFDPHFVLKRWLGDSYILTLSFLGKYGLCDTIRTLELGSIKTSSEDLEETDMVQKMTALYGACLTAYEKIVVENQDDFMRKGYIVYYLDKSGKKSSLGYFLFSTREQAVKHFQNHHEKDPEEYAKAVIRDNMSREKTIIGGESLC